MLLRACLFFGLLLGLVANVPAADPEYGVTTGPTAQATQWAKDNGFFFVEVYKKPGILFLYRGTNQVGTWQNNKYYPYDHKSGKHFPACLPPWAPEAKVSEETPTPNYGVVVEKVSPQPNYTVNGKPVTREEALLAVEDDSVPDESSLMRVVAVGSDSFQRSVMDDWAKHQDYHRSALLSCYAPDYWWAKANDLPADSLVVVKPDGKAVHFQKGFSPGDFALLAQVFDPAKVPDARAKDAVSDLWNKVVAWVQANQFLSLAIAAGLAYWWYKNKTPA